MRPQSKSESNKNNAAYWADGDTSWHCGGAAARRGAVNSTLSWSIIYLILATPHLSTKLYLYKPKLWLLVKTEHRNNYIFGCPNLF